jgi:hypothetical protein
MAQSPSRYAARELSPEERDRIAAQSRQDAGPRRRAFLRLYTDELQVLSAILDPAAALQLEIMRLSGLRRVQRQYGWMVLDRETITRAGLADRQVRYRAAKRLVKLGWLETRGSREGHKLEYRLNPGWAKPKAEMIDLAAHRKKETV